MPITTGDCYMHRQASFYNTLFPEGTTVGPPDSGSDVTFFYLPVAEAGDPKVMLGAGDIIAAGTDKPETWDTILYMSSNEYAIAMANGHAGAVATYTTSTPSLITDPLLASFAELLASSEIFRFDGADHDARRGRVRHVLDGGDGLDRRWQHRGHARQHRSQLARLTSN